MMNRIITKLYGFSKFTNKLNKYYDYYIKIMIIILNKLEYMICIKLCIL